MSQSPAPLEAGTSRGSKGIHSVHQKSLKQSPFLPEQEEGTLSQGFLSANSWPAAGGLFLTSLWAKARESPRVLTFSGTQRSPNPDPPKKKRERVGCVGCENYDQERKRIASINKQIEVQAQVLGP